MRGAWSVLVLVLAGCSGPEPGIESLVLDDSSDFGQWVQPTLRDTCSSLDCHGNVGRPLRLYALSGLRLDAGLRGQSESDSELEANVLSLASLDTELVLAKPLSEDDGGYEHEGGTLFTDRQAPGYLCLQGWLDGLIPGNAVLESACQSAASSLSPDP